MHLWRQRLGAMPQQLGRHHAGVGIGGRHFGRQENPDPGHAGDQMQFPAIDPAMPPAFGPMSRGVSAGVRHFPLLP